MIGRSAAVRAAALLLAAALAAACTSTTSGSGSAAAGRASSATSGTTRDFPTSAVASSASSASPGPSSPAPAVSSASPSSSGPAEAPAPKECARASDCTLVKSWDVGGGYVVAVFGAPKAAGGIGSSVLLLGRDRTPVYWHVFDGATPAELLCKVAAGNVRNCVLVNYVGAHAATAYPLVVNGDSLTIGTSVGSDTPGLHVADLNGDLLVDAYGLENDYKPSYATGHVQWQTWRRSSDGTSLTSTGCGPLSASAPTPPTAFQGGRCTSG